MTAYCTTCRRSGGANHRSTAAHRQAAAPAGRKADRSLDRRERAQFYAMRWPAQALEGYYRQLAELAEEDAFMAWFLAEANSRPDDGMVAA